MSPHTNFHAPGTSLSGRIQIGHKSGLFIYLLFDCEYKASQALAFAWGWQFICKSFAEIRMSGIYILRLGSKILYVSLELWSGIDTY